MFAAARKAVCVADYSLHMRLGPEHRALKLSRLLEPVGQLMRGKQNEYRNDTSDHPGAGARGRDSNLAPQQAMGLLPQRWSWFDTGDRVDSFPTGKNIAAILHRAERSAYDRSNRT
jgi:hypothetical protein